MKVVILAGGFGTRISEESHLKPKPMVEIVDAPILWHIMKIYSHYGFNEFVICLGYKGYVIKEYFNNYFLHMSDITFDFSKENTMEIHNHIAEPWKVTLIDTGISTMTGGRVSRIKPYVNNETFMLTYGDGISDVNINSLLAHHNKYKPIITLTAVPPEQRFGMLHFAADDDAKVIGFKEKPKDNKSWINGGFMVVEPKIFNYIENDEIVFEQEPMIRLSEEGNLSAFRHTGFWRPMDTLRDKMVLEELWRSGKAPWKVW